MNEQLILDFWFGSSDEPNYGKPRKEWFIKNIEFDLQVRSQFLYLYEQAAKGQLDHWKKTPLSCLAFSRNNYRPSKFLFNFYFSDSDFRLY